MVNQFLNTQTSFLLSRFCFIRNLSLSRSLTVEVLGSQARCLVDVFNSLYCRDFFIYKKRFLIRWIHRLLKVKTWKWRHPLLFSVILGDNVLISTHGYLVVSNNSPFIVHSFTFNCPIIFNNGHLKSIICNNGHLKLKEWTVKCEL